MVVLGSMGSINGSIVAATLITIINFILTKNLSGDLAALKFLIYAIILIVIVIVNNAPGLAPIKETLSLKRLFAKMRSKLNNHKNDPSKVKDDDAAWDRIPTKIEMDAILSLDLKQDNTYTPDKREEE